MFASRQHPVRFFAKPAMRSEAPRLVRQHLELRQTREGLHHQLRLTALLEGANTMVEVASFGAHLEGLAQAMVLNFRHDLTFARRLFPHQSLVTVLNDDFVAGAKAFSRRSAEGQLARTIAASDHVLVVSHSLAAQARRYTDQVSLFFPWARRKYVTPVTTLPRRDLLYWGYLNERIDFDVARGVLDAGIVIHFAGPVSGAGSAALLAHPNARYHGTASLDQLAEVCAQCAAAILPYDLHGRQKYGDMVAAITINNRAFELLAAGLPLLYADLPGLLEAPANVIMPCRTIEDYVSATRHAATMFDSIQPEIGHFLQKHTEDARYEQLTALFARVDAGRGAVTLPSG